MGGTCWLCLSNGNYPGRLQFLFWWRWATDNACHALHGKRVGVFELAVVRFNHCLLKSTGSGCHICTISTVNLHMLIIKKSTCHRMWHPSSRPAVKVSTHSHYLRVMSNLSPNLFKFIPWVKKTTHRKQSKRKYRPEDPEEVERRQSLVSSETRPITHPHYVL